MHLRFWHTTKETRGRCLFSASDKCPGVMHLSMLCPQRGRPGVPSGFARNFLPQVGIFTILQSPRVGTFDKS